MIEVDLGLSPERRWEALDAHRAVAREMLAFFVRDIGGLRGLEGMLAAYRDAWLKPEHVGELRGVARVLGASEEEVTLVNLYYDLLKLVLMSGSLGCTAFGVEGPSGPLLARNLDWITAGGLLTSETLVANFHRHGVVRYRTVTWPGFIGCLSGVAPGRFAVTLNAVLSDDPPHLAAPVAFVLREVLESAASFEDARDVLRRVELASDCLLLLTGCAPGEMAVIERTPTRSALRGPDQGVLVVTNDYRALSATDRTHATLSETACGRYDRARARAVAERPTAASECLDILRDSRVRMGITAQHMVLCAGTGSVDVALPAT